MSSDITCGNCGRTGHYACGTTSVPGGFGRWTATKVIPDQSGSGNHVRGIIAIPPPEACETAEGKLIAENAKLRERVRELEAKQGEYERSYPAAIRQMSHAEEDLRRKREECDRLEAQLGDMRRQNNRLERERTELREANGYLVTEERRLRRELGKRK